MTPKKKTPELIAILDGGEMGRVTPDNRARLTFTYNEDCRTAENAYPLSISMLLALAQHSNARIDPFLWGLLPDNQLVLDQWARKFHVSPRNAFSLISAVGEDCAGAVQFVRPERLEVIRRRSAGNRVAHRSQYRAASASPARGSLGVAHPARHGPVQSRGGAAENRTSAREWQMGRAHGPRAHDAHSPT